MEIVTANLAGTARRKIVNGREYIVAPLTMIVPGVLNGSKGALHYPPEEVAKSADAWNHVPIVIYHPFENGQPCSARSAGVLNRQGVGVVMRTRVRNGRLVGDGLFDVKITRRVDPRVFTALETGQPLEISTGLFTENEPAPPGASFNGKPYDYIARNYQPDHLAILPDQVGACSLNDGCGVFMLNQTFNDYRGAAGHAPRIRPLDGEPLLSPPLYEPKPEPETGHDPSLLVPPQIDYAELSKVARTLSHDQDDADAPLSLPVMRY